jgi:hypothetical protein
MATRIDVDGTETVLTDISLKTLQTAVGGYIEVVRLHTVTKDRALMIANEEGVLDNLSLNILASEVAGQTIVGPVVFLTKAEAKKF